MKGWMAYNPEYRDLKYFEPTGHCPPMTLKQIDTIVGAVRQLAEAYDVPWSEVMATQARFLTEGEFADIIGELQQ